MRAAVMGQMRRQLHEEHPGRYDNWQHLCTVAPQRVTSREALRQLAADYELRAVFSRRGVLVQQAVTGPLVMAQSVFAHGELVAYHACERVREGASGGLRDGVLHHEDYWGSREELTPGDGLLAGLPVALTAAATLVRPAAWRYPTGGSTGACSLSPGAWEELTKAD